MNICQRWFFLIGAACLCLFPVNAQTTTISKFPKVQIMGSEVRTLTSKETGRAYDLYIHLPAAPTNGKKYPVVYVLDGQWDFKLMDSVYGGLFYDKFVPEMVVVGITSSGENPNHDSLRAMDYTPTAVTHLPGSGDGPKFLAFLKKDVMPFIEKEYNGDPSKRVLMGSSLGGLFTLYTMFTEPGLFYGYIAASPAVTHDDGYSLKQEKKFAEGRKDLPVRLFISVGSVEGLTQPVKDFIQAMKGRAYKGLKMEDRIIEGERHSGNKPESFNRGLRFIFSE
jgi:predicted alpha/beta superfamily hydrolase